MIGIVRAVTAAGAVVFVNGAQRAKPMKYPNNSGIVVGSKVDVQKESGVYIIKSVYGGAANG
jgi:hypothetical protein